MPEKLEELELELPPPIVFTHLSTHVPPDPDPDPEPNRLSQPVKPDVLEKPDRPEKPESPAVSFSQHPQMFVQAACFFPSSPRGLHPARLNDDTATTSPIKHP